LTYKDGRCKDEKGRHIREERYKDERQKKHIHKIEG
jgi:hypothetical protein